MIKCPNCTGELKFNPTDKVIKCEYCGTIWNPSVLKEKVKFATKKETTENVVHETLDANTYSCTQCGAELLTFDETAVTFCSYCGSQAIIKDKMVKINKPDFVIPFSKNKEECINEYKKKISKSLFVPEYMKEDVIVQKFRGIYMPYGIYNLEHTGASHNSGRKYAYRRGDYVYYNTYDIIADVDAHCYGISYDLSSDFYDRFSHSTPHDFREAKPFDPNYLLGYYADALDVDSSVYDQKACKIIEEDSKKVLKRRREYSSFGCSEPKINFSVTDRKVGMFPVYFLSVKDKKNDKVHYAIVNGQTGKVAADLPIDFLKYIVGSLIITPFIFLLICNLFLFTPKTVLFISMVFGIICLVILIYQSNTIKNRELHSDDLGYRYVNTLRMYKDKNLGIFKCIVSIVLPIILFFLNFAADEFYYFGSFISLLFVLWSFKSIIDKHNEMVSNKLPQLNKRGGDESE